MPIEIADTLRWAISRLPPHMHEVAAKYFTEHQHPGDFAYYVFSNDLMRAAGHADSSNLHALPQWAQLLYAAPGNTVGSKEVVDQWLQSRPEESNSPI